MALKPCNTGQKDEKWIYMYTHTEGMYILYNFTFLISIFMKQGGGSELGCLDLNPSLPVIGLPGWLTGKQSTCNAGAEGDVGLIPGLGRCPEGGDGNPLQYSCLENPTDRGAWRATVHRVTESDMTEVTEDAHMYYPSLTVRLGASYLTAL